VKLQDKWNNQVQTPISSVSAPETQQIFKFMDSTLKVIRKYKENKIITNGNFLREDQKFARRVNIKIFVILAHSICTLTCKKQTR
jgi:hypothetical protein